MSLHRVRLALVWLAALGGSALLIVAVTLDVREAMKLRNAAPHADTTVDFFSGSTRYAVPVKYHPGITGFSERRKYSALNLMLFLPDLSPAADHPEDMKRPGWYNQMTLLFEHGPHMLAPDAQIAWMTDWPHGAHTHLEPGENGCDVYRTPLALPGDVYVCPEGDSKLVIACTRKFDVPSPECTVFENVNDDLSLIYHYSVKYITDAVSIDMRVRALIDSFVIPRTTSIN